MNNVSSFERGFAIVSLAYFAKAFSPFIAGFHGGGFSMQEAALGNPIDQVVGGVIYVVSFYLLLRDRNRMRALLVSPMLVAFILLTISSLLWSAVPDVTLRRSGGLLGTAAFGGFLAWQFTPREVVSMVAAAFCITIALSILLIIYAPSYATADGTEIAGVYGQKNELGRAMIFAILALWALLRDPESSPQFWALAALIAAVVLLLLSRSAQAVVGLAAAYGVIIPALIVCSKWFKRISVRLGIFLLTIAAVLGVLLAETSEQLLALLGRDATLTDRTLIWDILTEFALEQPWLGRGYGAFWFSDVSAWFADRWGSIDHAHNGYMDLWLELGFVGLAGFVLLLLSASRTAWNAYLEHPTPARAFFPAFIFVAALVNSVGRLIPAHNSIYWVLLCYCALMQLSLKRDEYPYRSRYRVSPLRPTSSEGVLTHADTERDKPDHDRKKRDTIQAPGNSAA